MKKKILLPILFLLLSKVVSAYDPQYSQKDKVAVTFDIFWFVLKNFIIDYWYLWLLFIVLGLFLRYVRNWSRGEN